MTATAEASRAEVVAASGAWSSAGDRSALGAASRAGGREAAGAPVFGDEGAGTGSETTSGAAGRGWAGSAGATV